jgi:hypothetical protein
MGKADEDPHGSLRRTANTLSGKDGVEHRLIQTDPTKRDHDEYFARLKKGEE